MSKLMLRFVHAGNANVAVATLFHPKVVRVVAIDCRLLLHNQTSLHRLCVLQFSMLCAVSALVVLAVAAHARAAEARLVCDHCAANNAAVCRL